MSPAETRRERAGAFLAAAGWGDAPRAPLAGDASFRRYHRLRGPAGSAVLMDAPPDAGEDCRPFVAIGAHLRRLGFSAPAVLAADLAEGFLLIEDLGDDLYARVLSAGGDETSLYAEAVDLLDALHAEPAPAALPVPDAAPYVLPDYSEARLQAEVDLLPEWYLPECSGRPTAPDLIAEYRALWRDLLPAMQAQAPVLVLRDFHAENLLWLPQREGLARIGLLDYQDGVIGHPAYDLVSLLSDARRDVPPALADAMVARYAAAAAHRDPAFDEAAFRTAFAVLGAQRNCKIIGIFARLWRRDGKPGYLALIPRVWRNLERDLEHPALAHVREWLDRMVPPASRSVPLPSAARV